MQYIITPNSGNESPNSSKIVFVEVHFGEGSLGVTLRRKVDTGIVYIYDIVEGSQADLDLDVKPNDELWAVSSSDFKFFLVTKRIEKKMGKEKEKEKEKSNLTLHHT